MKILMLGWELPPYNSGGLGEACYHLSKALAKCGAKIDFVIPNTGKTFNNIDFMNVHQVTSDDETVTSLHQLSYQSEYVDDIIAHQAEYKKFVERHIKKHGKPNVIHAHDWLTLEAGVHAKKVSGKPLIAHVHATEFDRSGGGYGNPVIHEIEQHGLSVADKIIAVSQYTKELIVKIYGIPEEKIDVVHNSYTPGSISGSEDIAYKYIEMMKREGYSVVTTVGRLTLQKGLTHFLDGCASASHRYDRLLFVVAGSGEQRDELIERAAELGIAEKTIFTGFVRGDALKKLYEISDMFVMSSISEPFGITALEAVAHKTPVILTKQSGVYEVLSNSLSYNYWDTNRLADMIINIAASSGLKKELSDNALEQFKSMSWDKMAERCLGVYRGLVRRGLA